MRITLLLVFLAGAVSPTIATAQRPAVITPPAAQATAPLRYQTICFITRSVELYQQPSKTSARLGTVQKQGGFIQLTLAEDSKSSDQWLRVVEGYLEGKRQPLSGYVWNDRVATPTNPTNAIHGCIVEPSFTAPVDTVGKLPGNSDTPQADKPVLPQPKPPDVTPPFSVAKVPSLYIGCTLNRSVPLYEKPDLKAKRIGIIKLPAFENAFETWEEPVELILAVEDDGTGQWLHINQVLQFSDYKVQSLSGYVLNDQKTTPNKPSNAIKGCGVIVPQAICTLDQAAIIYEKPNLAARRIDRKLVGEGDLEVGYEETIYDGDRQWQYFDRVLKRVGGKVQIQPLSGYVLGGYSGPCIAAARANSGRVQVRQKPARRPRP